MTEDSSAKSAAVATASEHASGNVQAVAAEVETAVSELSVPAEQLRKSVCEFLANISGCGLQNIDAARVHHQINAFARQGACAAKAETL